MPQKKFVSLNEMAISFNEMMISFNEMMISFNEMNFLLGIGKVFSRGFGTFLPGLPILLGQMAEGTPSRSTSKLWESRIGPLFGTVYLFLGRFVTQ